MNRHVLSAAALVLAACSGPGGQPTSLQEAYAVLTGDNGTVTPRFMALTGTPRPILQVGLPDAGTAGNMLLEARNGDFEHYLSPNAASITLNRGMLHNMFGFNEGLMATEVTEPLRLILAGQGGTADRIHTYLGGDDRTVFRTYRCVISPMGTQPVQLMNRTVTARLMREECRNADHEFTNLYWVDQTRGDIVQSRQWAGPNIGAVSTRRAGLSG